MSYTSKKLRLTIFVLLALNFILAKSENSGSTFTVAPPQDPIIQTTKDQQSPDSQIPLSQPQSNPEEKLDPAPGESPGNLAEDSWSQTLAQISKIADSLRNLKAYLQTEPSDQDTFLSHSDPEEDPTATSQQNTQTVVPSTQKFQSQEETIEHGQNANLNDMRQNEKQQTSELKSGEESKSSSVPENSEVFYGKERELDKKIKKKIQKAMEDGQKDLMKEGGRIVETAGKLVDEIVGTDGEMKEEEILKLMGELEDEAEELGEKIPEAKEKTKKMILEVLSRVEGCLRDMAEYVKAKKDGVSDKTASILVKPVEWIEKLKVKGKNLKEEAKLMFEGLKDGQWKEKVKTFGSKVGGSMKKGYEYVKENSKIAYQSAVSKTKSFAKKVGDFVQETLKLDL